MFKKKASRGARTILKNNDGKKEECEGDQIAKDRTTDPPSGKIREVN